MPDIILTCPECQNSFMFSEEDQATCEAQAFPPPTFCQECHLRRKAAKSEARGSQRHSHRGRRR